MAKTGAILAAEEALRRLLLGEEIEDYEERRKLIIAAFGGSGAKVPDMWQEEQVPAPNKGLILEYLLGTLPSEKEAEVHLLIVTFEAWAKAGREIFLANREAIRAHFDSRTPKDRNG